jgi:hypothetical protein
MEQDKSPGSSLASSNLSRGSNHSQRFTRAVASKSLDFSLASGLPALKRKRRILKQTPFHIMATSSSIDREKPDSTLDDVIDRHRLDFGKDKRTGRPLLPPFIPMCRLVPMELVRTLQRVSEAVEKLEETFTDDGYLEKIGSKFYVQTTDKDGKEMHITEEYKAKWDDLWKSQDELFVKECEANEAFASLKNNLFCVLDGNHRLYAWSRIAERNPTVLKYHPRVECVILKGDPTSLVEIEFAMHGINK